MANGRDQSIETARQLAALHDIEVIATSESDELIFSRGGLACQMLLDPFGWPQIEEIEQRIANLNHQQWRAFGASGEQQVWQLDQRYAVFWAGPKRAKVPALERRVDLAGFGNCATVTITIPARGQRFRRLNGKTASTASVGTLSDVELHGVLSGEQWEQILDGLGFYEVEIVAQISNSFANAEGDLILVVDPEPSDLGYIEQSVPQKLLTVCRDCSNLYGKTHGGNMLVCAMHPTGPDSDSGQCPDYESIVNEPSSQNFWILDGQTPVCCPSPTEWAERSKTANWHVAKDRIQEFLISTVFLGVNHQFGSGPPLLFETMVFDETDADFMIDDIECRRYSTWAEAEAGHLWAIEQVRARLSRP